VLTQEAVVNLSWLVMQRMPVREIEALFRGVLPVLEAIDRGEPIPTDAQSVHPQPLRSAHEHGYAAVVGQPIQEAELDEEIERAQRPVARKATPKKPPDDRGGVVTSKAGGGTKGPTKGGAKK
jgi:hypothetical protein